MHHSTLRLKKYTDQRRRAFTLVELLVVIGLIAVLAGGIGLAFGGGDKANALQGAQGTLQSLASAVRGQAALAGNDAALFVNVNGATAVENNQYLRSFIIAKYDGSSWIVVGDEVSLPGGIYLVPSVAGGQVSSIDGYRTSDTVSVSTTEPLRYSDGTTTYPGNYAMVLRLDSRGKKADSGSGSASQLVLSPAEIDSSGADLRLRFIQPELVRGAIISKYGVLTPINDEAGFN